MLGKKSKRPKHNIPKRPNNTNNQIEKLPFFPFQKKRTGKTISLVPKGKLKEPFLILMRTSGSVDIFQNVNSESITIHRGNHEVDIQLPLSKLHGFEWGGETVKGWIASEAEAIAYPTNVTHDSLELKRIIDTMSLNYKNYETKRIETYTGAIIKIAMVIGAIIIGMFLVGALFNVNFAEVFFPTKEIITQIPQTIDYNSGISVI